MTTTLGRVQKGTTNEELPAESRIDRDRSRNFQRKTIRVGPGGQASFRVRENRNAVIINRRRSKVSGGISKKKDFNHNRKTAKDDNSPNFRSVKLSGRLKRTRWLNVLIIDRKIRKYVTEKCNCIFHSIFYNQ